MSKVKCIGIMAEDRSDFESVAILIKRIARKENIAFKKAIGNGCGKLKRKAADFAVDLKRRGCDMLILLHDLDRNDFVKLKTELDALLKKSPISNKLVCIPIEEIEGWFLSDPDSLKAVFKLKRRPNVRGNPELILSPKEKLEEFIYSCSNKETIYLNTEHNRKIANKISIDLMKAKCVSFKHLYDFVNNYTY